MYYILVNYSNYSLNPFLLFFSKQKYLKNIPGGPNSPN